MTKILIDGTGKKLIAINAINDLPTDGSMIVEIKKFTKRRSSSQNSLQWVGLLGDFSMQVDVDGRKFSPDIWHEFLKKEFLPEDFDEELTLPGYRKWDVMPDGSLKLVGSTTKLTTRGMNEYLEQCYSYGCNEHSIRFSTNKQRQ